MIVKQHFRVSRKVAKWPAQRRNALRVNIIAFPHFHTQVRSVRLFLHLLRLPHQHAWPHHLPRGHHPQPPGLPSGHSDPGLEGDPETPPVPGVRGGPPLGVGKPAQPPGQEALDEDHRLRGQTRAEEGGKDRIREVKMSAHCNVVQQQKRFRIKGDRPARHMHCGPEFANTDQSSRRLCCCRFLIGAWNKKEKSPIVTASNKNASGRNAPNCIWRVCLYSLHSDNGDERSTPKPSRTLQSRKEQKFFHEKGNKNISLV